MIVNWDNLTDTQKIAVTNAEEKIRKILFDLEEKTNLYIASVQVDTRNFEQLCPAIELTTTQRI